uniref:Uncharacterized protein n=1 Tax=Panagrolaimus davidi TaxID=227884 RepID=A0A914P9C4_9BILA
MDIFNGEKNVPLKYKFAVEKLLFNIKIATKLSEIRKLFTEFSQVYTVIPALWLEWIRLEQNPQFPDFKLSELRNRRKKIKQLANTHFCSKNYFILDKKAIETGNFEQSLNFPWQNYSKIANAKCDLPNFTTEGLQKALEFPHSELKNVMEFCCKWAGK